ncbi:MAG: hypothetical protein ACRDYB_01415 [Acidimicrobiales bacterium]
MTTTLDAPAVAPSRQRLSWRWSHHFEILVVSFSALVIEVSYTRVISYKLFYYYVYLIIGLALLGIGTGAVLVAVSKRLKRASTDQVMFWSLSLSAVVTVGAYVLIAFIRIDTLAVWQYGTTASTRSFLMLLVICVSVFASFVGPGVIIATLFGRQPEGIGGLYFADLVGAGIGCGTVIYFVSSLGAPAAVMVAALAMAACGLWVSLRLPNVQRALAVALVAGAAFLVASPGSLPAQRLDSSKTGIPIGNVVFSGWGSIFRVDAGVFKKFPDQINLYHDGILGSGIYKWNGKRSFLDVYDIPRDPRAIPFDVLPTAPSQEAVIGAAGGHEVLDSMYYGVGHIDAVELNPVTVNLVRTVFADYDGHLAQNPHVTYDTADGRSFMARTSKQFQLVWYPAPDSYAATNGALSSAYVLSESYLYTTNGVQSDLQHLTDNGIFVAQFGEVDDTYFLRTTRFVATARQALANLGITDARDHILVAVTQTHFLGTIPLSTIVVSKQAFTPAEIAGFDRAVKAVPETSPYYAPNAHPRANPINSLMRTSNAGLDHFYATFPFDVTPTTDNDPFFWHFSRYGTVLSNYTHRLSSVDREKSVGERVLVLLLGLSIVIAAVFLLLPFAAVRKTWVQLPRKTLSGFFFAGLGFGFIFFEVTLMQLLNLFLGYPTYSLTIVLMSLLVFTGVGALISARIPDARRAIPVLFVAVAALCLFYLLGLTPLTNSMLHLSLAARIPIAFVVLAPLGLCLGMFMPLGLGHVAGLGTFPKEYVAWGWAINGFASVVGSASATILAMIYGFDFVLFLGLMAYLVALLAWLRLSRAPGGRRRGLHQAAPA